MRTQIVTQKQIRWVQRLSNGGFRAYWSLYSKSLEAINDTGYMAKKIAEALQREKLSGTDLEKAVNWELKKLRFYSRTTMFVWSCLIKPFGQFFSRKINIEGTYQIDGSKLVWATSGKEALCKSTTYYLFGIPCWYSTNQRFTDEEYAELLK